MQTKRGRQRYALRMETVEPVFGQIKQARGFRQFLLRGLEKVNREWLLICTGDNLLKLFRHGADAPVAAQAKGAAESIRKSAGFANGVIFKKLLGCQRLQPARIVAANWCPPAC